MSTEKLDRRRYAYRDDLAAVGLESRVRAPRYAEGYRHQVLRASTAVRRQPDSSLGLETELLFGEVFTVYDKADGWAWGQAERDGYVGYVPDDALSSSVAEPTHRVTAIGTFIYPVPDIKSPPRMHVSLNTPLAVAEPGDRFSALATGGYVVSRHIGLRSKAARDYVEIAERLLGVPYLWGGRTRIGVDCSGLVQLAMEAAGLGSPRDSDMQQAEVGDNVLVPVAVDGAIDGLQRGDLVFWRGHVGIMADGVMLLHANAHHMAVVVEPLAAAVHRISKTGSEIVAIKRPSGLSV